MSLQSILRLAIPVVLLCVATSAAQAQFGAGVGIVSIGSDIREAEGRVGDATADTDVTYEEVSNGLGFYGSARMKYGLTGALRLTGDLSYIYLPAEEIRVTGIEVNGQEVSGTFDVGVSMIPIGVGLDLAIPIPLIRPYISGHAAYTFVSRTSVYVSGSEQLNNPEIQNSWGNDNEFGAGFGAGVELAFGGLFALDAGFRYNVVNMFTKASDESTFQHLQLGATIYFGSTMASDDDDDDDDDDQ